ncbi:MAG: glucose-1-phosphate cytidylyltransferase [Elusimicrobiota bacterium]|nr:glucose-1-phosphate cytidylyltransferase [Elusimicrobiota bacterium]
MKAVILAGGLGTRISEETGTRPKPMVEVGGKPILWHILKIYSAHGVNDFVICLGYKGFVIKEYFANYFLHSSDVTFDMARNKMTVHHRAAEPWKVTLVDTGADTMTGGRLKRVRPYLDRGPFHMTYGDGVSDVDLRALTAAHKKGKSDATLTAVRAPMRFGTLDLSGTKVKEFREKADADGTWINGGFFVVEPKALDLVKDDATRWEGEPVTELARRGRLGAYRHEGFWCAMDTLRDKTNLESLWATGRAPWKVW